MVECDSAAECRGSVNALVNVNALVVESADIDPTGLVRATGKEHGCGNSRQDQSLRSTELPVWRCRMGTENGDAIKPGVHASAARQTAYEARRKNRLGVLSIHRTQNSTGSSS